MDAIVEAALQKWPNVPHCRGWLGLDARGQWYLRDEATQAAGAFPAAKGSLVEHRKLREFIERNYACDADGAWFFQNGPQRVYVELDAAPLVWRLMREDGGRVTLTSHCGVEAEFGSMLSDEHGRVFIATRLGLGLVHSSDMNIVAEQVEQAAWTVETVRWADLPQRFRFVPSPASSAAQSS